MNLAQCIGIFLSLYAYMNPGSEVSFPGPESAWKSLHTDSSQDLIGKFSIFVSLNPSKTASQAFNIVNEARPVSWSMIWPGVCNYFGLKGVGPDPTNDGPLGADWVTAKEASWKPWLEEKGLKEDVIRSTDWGIMHGCMDLSTFDRQFDVSRAREIGFAESIDTVKSYHIAFDRMKAAKIIAT